MIFPIFSEPFHRPFDGASFNISSSTARRYALRVNPPELQFLLVKLIAGIMWEVKGTADIEINDSIKDVHVTAIFELQSILLCVMMPESGGILGQSSGGITLNADHRNGGSVTSVADQDLGVVLAVGFVQTIGGHFCPAKEKSQGNLIIGPRIFQINFRKFISQLILVIGWGIFRETTLRLMSELTDDKSTLVQVMAWCHQVITWTNVDPDLGRHMSSLGRTELTRWDWVTHICISKLTIIGSNRSLSPGRHRAIIWTNDGMLLIGPQGTNFREISIEIHTFSFKKIHLKMSSGKCRPHWLDPNALT